MAPMLNGEAQPVNIYDAQNHRLMARLPAGCRKFSAIDLWMTLAAIASAVLLIFAASQSQAQTFSQIYSFTGLGGGSLTSTPVLDRAGRLYGTAEEGQSGSCVDYGMAYRLALNGSNWLLNPLHCFNAPLGGNDGAYPIDYGGLTFGPDGKLYGTTDEGGIGCSSGTCSLGTVFKLSPPPSACHTALCPWTSTILYKFGTNNPDGLFPEGNVIFDSAGNMYGTTSQGGNSNLGTVFKLTPSGSGWSESIIYSFTTGASPAAGVVMDRAGNLYGTIPFNRGGFGYVFELSPSGSGWTESVIYAFTGGADGAGPMAGLVFDQAGNLYGATYRGGASGGVVYELSPSSNGWTFNVLHSLEGNGGPMSALTLDAAGNLYGTTVHDGRSQLGNIFELSPGGGSWTYTDLHSFVLGDPGAAPVAGVAVAPDGTLYGASGTIAWKITR